MACAGGARQSQRIADRVHLGGRGAEYSFTTLADTIVSVLGDHVDYAPFGVAGGYGNPLLPDLALVERDFNRGYLSRATAENTYGVVVTDARSDAAGHLHYKLDETASAQRRQQLANA